MKRMSIFLLALLCLFAFSACGDKSAQMQEEYCYKINLLIQDVDFEHGTVKDGRIVLYRGDTEVFNQAYADYDASIKIKSIRKDENKVFFVFNASADDDEGIVFVNDDMNRLMDGIWSMERIGGNAYKYKTHK